jgi:hypothetical protein
VGHADRYITDSSVLRNSSAWVRAVAIVPRAAEDNWVARAGGPVTTKTHVEEHDAGAARSSRGSPLRTFVCLDLYCTHSPGDKRQAQRFLGPGAIQYRFSTRHRDSGRMRHLDDLVRELRLLLAYEVDFLTGHIICNREHAHVRDCGVLCHSQVHHCRFYPIGGSIL